MVRRSFTLGSDALRAMVRENTPAALGAYLRRLAQASVAAAALSGCASSFPPEDELEQPACSADGRWLAVHDLSLPSQHESISAWDGGGFVRVVTMIDEIGVRCATATDPAACNAEVEASSETFGRFLVTVDGDTIARHATEGEVLALLGPIDTANEALLRAWNAGYDVGCGDLQRYAVRAVEGGYEVVATRMVSACDPVEVHRYLLFVATEGTVTILQEETLSSESGLCIGRRPAGLAGSVEPAIPSHLGSYFAQIARLEGSAVDAFYVLAQELELLGAPGDLVDAARTAARDEVRHEESMGRLARRFGAVPLRAEVEARAPRPLFEVALENAVEGCVRETFGALMGMHQAMAASDPSVLLAMREIAAEETQHAELSWKIARWAEPLLSDDERAAIQSARARAVLELRAEMSTEPDEAIADVAGLPPAAVSVALIDEMSRTIWAS
jgi:hypothetical protein